MLTNITRTIFILIILFTIGFNAGAQIDTLPKLPAADSGIFTKVDIEARYLGGEKAWIRFLSTNLDSDVPVRKKAPAGNYHVVVQFIVDEQGGITDIEPLTEWGYGMEAEVVRILNKSPRWAPAILKGRPVKAYRKQPVTFMVEEEKRKERKKTGDQ
jgi:protein TonB